MGGWQISWEQKCRGSCGQALPHSESTANLLMRNGANFDIFSECALILLANWSDFDSAIRRFDSSRPSQPVRSLEIFPAKSLESPPLAGFFPQPKSLRIPNLVILRPTVPKFSARSRHYYHFLEKQTGDWVRSHCVVGLPVLPWRIRYCLFAPCPPLGVLTGPLLCRYQCCQTVGCRHGERQPWSKLPKFLPQPTCPQLPMSNGLVKTTKKNSGRRSRSRR